MEIETYPLIGEELKILQRKDLYRFGMEAVLLADFVQGSPGDKVVDLGSGDGVIPLLLAYKKGLQVLGFELQKDMVSLSRRSVELNGLERSIQIEEMDIKEIPASLPRNSHCIVTANPPFFPRQGGRINPNPSLAMARHELACTLMDVLQAGAHLLQQGGVLYLVHRPERLVDLLAWSRKLGLEGKTLRFIHPRQGKPSNMMLLALKRGAKAGGLQVKEPLFVYDGEEYTEEVKAIYGQDI